MSKFTWHIYRLRADQAVGIAAICANFEQRTGERLEPSTVASESIDSSLPLVRQRYDELARQGKESE